jgi:hypothetical protein
VLLQIALELPVLGQLRLDRFMGLTGLIALRDETFNAPAGFRPELL